MTSTPMDEGLRPPEGRAQEDFYDLFCWLLSCAANLGREPRIYGPLRLVTTVNRIIDVLELHDLSHPSFDEIRQRLETERPKALNDPAAFLEAIDNVVLAFARREANGLKESGR